MKTVTEISRIAGISVRTLHHYDAIGLLKPTEVTEAGYRLYDEEALARLYRILVFRELGFSLKEIGTILNAPDHDRNRILQKQIEGMQNKLVKLQKRIHLAKGIYMLGVKEMNFEGFSSEKIDQYSEQAKVLYGKTEAYQEFTQKSRCRTKEQEEALGRRVMDFFARLGKMRPCSPDSEAARQWAAELQAFFTEHYYTCTPQIFRGLAESYAGGGSLTENIDRVGGAGTGAFAKEVIDTYLNGVSE